MVDPIQFSEYIIKPALVQLDMDSPAARELLLGTAIQESKLSYLKQIRGPALGVYQIEPDTHHDVYANYLSYRPELRHKVEQIADRDDQNLIGNLWYATAIARLIYYRASEPLPQEGDVEAMAAYWKRHYNTFQGKGSINQYISNWYRYT